MVIDGDLVCLGDGLVFADDRADEFGQRERVQGEFFGH